MVQKSICKKIISLFTILIVVGSLAIGAFLPKKADAQVANVTAQDIPRTADKWKDWALGMAVDITKSLYIKMLQNVQMRIITGESDVPLWPEDTKEYLEKAGMTAGLTAASIWLTKGKYDLCQIPTAALAGILSAESKPVSTENPPLPPCEAAESWLKVAKGEPLELDDFVRIAEPQNNFFGAYLVYSDAVGRQVLGEQTRTQAQLIAGQGALGVQKEIMKEEEITDWTAVGKCRDEGGDFNECRKENTEVKKVPTGEYKTYSPGKFVMDRIMEGDSFPYDEFKNCNVGKSTAKEAWKSCLSSGIGLAADMTLSAYGQKWYREGVQKYYEWKK